MNPLYFVYLLILSSPLCLFSHNEAQLGFLLDSNHLPPELASTSKEPISIAPSTLGLVLSPVGFICDTSSIENPQSGRLSFTIQLNDLPPDDSEDPFLSWGNPQETPLLSIYKTPRQWIVHFENGNGLSTKLAFRSSELIANHWVDLSINWNIIDGNPFFWIRLNQEIVQCDQGFFIETLPSQLRIGGPQWKGLLAQLKIETQVALPQDLKPGERNILVNGFKPQGPLYPFWQVANFTGHGSVSFINHSDLDILKSRAPFAREVVVDYILGGRIKGGKESYLGLDSNGELITDFTNLIQRVQQVLDAGYQPWIGLENVPALMSDPPQWNTYGNSKPPADFALFYRYTRLAIEALVNQFGREKAASWHYFIATEPDLYPQHWSGTKESFLTLLDHTQAALLDVLPDANISPGNILNPAYNNAPPSTSTEGLNIVRARNQWGLDIIDHMAKGNTPAKRKMDFFSASWYHRIGKPIDSFDFAVSAIRNRLEKHPPYNDIPIDIREFGILLDQRGNRLYAGDASEWSSSFYAAIARKVYQLNIRNVFEWDHATLGVLQPRGQVIRMLNQMKGGQLLAVESHGTQSNAECNLIASQSDGVIYLLLYNHHHLRNFPVTESVHLDIIHPDFAQNNAYQLSEWVIDKNHGTWIHAFLQDAKIAGMSPLPQAGAFEASPNRLLGMGGLQLFKNNIEKYRALSAPAQSVDSLNLIVNEGHLKWDLTMPSHSVRLLKLIPQNQGHL